MAEASTLQHVAAAVTRIAAVLKAVCAEIGAGARSLAAVTVATGSRAKASFGALPATIGAGARVLTAFGVQAGTKLAGVRKPVSDTSEAANRFAGMAGKLFPPLAGLRFNPGTAEFGKFVQGFASGAGTRDALAFAEAQQRLKGAIDGVSIAVGAGLAPYLTPVAAGLADWIAQNQSLVAGLTTVVAVLGTASEAVQAFSALGQVLKANPMLLAVAGIAAAAYLIYDNWGGIADWFSNLWSGVAAAFDDVATRVGAVAATIVPTGLVTAWQALPGAFAAVFDAVFKTFEGLAGFVGGVFTGDMAGALDGLKLAWDGIGDYFDAVLSPVVAVFDAAWAAIRPILDGIAGGFAWLADSALGRTFGLAVEAAPADVARQVAAARAVEPEADPSEPEAAAIPVPASAARAPSLPAQVNASRASGGVPGRVGIDGAITAVVEFRNAPPGTVVTTESRGPVEARTSVNYGPRSAGR